MSLVHTVDLVVDESLTGVELAARLSVDEELYAVITGDTCKICTRTRTTSEPSMAVPLDVVETSPNGSSLGNSSAFRRAIYLISPIEGSGRCQ